MNRPLLAFAGLIAAGGTAVGVYVAVPGGGDEELVQQVVTATPAASEPTKAPELTPGPGMTLWRWGNVTVVVDDKSEIGVSRYIAPPQRNPPDGGPEIDLILGDSQVGVNAITGAVLYTAVSKEDQALFDEVLSSISVGSADAGTLPWPYTGEPPAASHRLQWGKISYIEPPPDSGVAVVGTIGDCVEVNCAGLDNKFIQVSNGNFTVFVTVRDGNLSSDVPAVPPSAQSAISRYLETVVLCISEGTLLTWHRVDRQPLSPSS